MLTRSGRLSRRLSPGPPRYLLRSWCVQGETRVARLGFRRAPFETSGRSKLHAHVEISQRAGNESESRLGGQGVRKPRSPRALADRARSAFGTLGQATTAKTNDCSHPEGGQP
jgi:hypothetical protein